MIFLTTIKLSDQFLRRAVHPDKEAAGAESLFIIFIDVVARKIINLVNYKIPSTKVEISHAKVHALHPNAGDNTP